jgi:Flp pilus assembly protein protease CpaA
MNPIDLGSWPLIVACGLLLFTAWSELYLKRVPNQVVLPLIVLGWFVGFLAASGQIPAGGGFGGSFVATFVALLVLLPIYATGGIGAGCVKSLMAMGAWIGCGLPFLPAVIVTGLAVLAGMLCTVVGTRSPLAEALYHVHDDHPAVREEGAVLFAAQVTISIGALAVIAGYIVLSLVMAG